MICFWQHVSEQNIHVLQIFRRGLWRFCSWIFIPCCAYFPVPAQALAAQVTQENFDKGLIYPPFSNIRKISAQIAANVAAKAYELGESFILIMQQLPYGEILN